MFVPTLKFCSNTFKHIPCFLGQTVWILEWPETRPFFKRIHWAVLELSTSHWMPSKSFVKRTWTPKKTAVLLLRNFLSCHGSVKLLHRGASFWIRASRDILWRFADHWLLLFGACPGPGPKQRPKSRPTFDRTLIVENVQFLRMNSLMLRFWSRNPA